MNLPPTNECVRCAHGLPVLWCVDTVRVGYVDLKPDVVRLVDLSTGAVLIVDCNTEDGITSFSQVLVPGHSYTLDLLSNRARVSFRPYIDDGSFLVLSDDRVKCITFTAYKPFGRVDSIDHITLST